jgi:hypothetical protein
MCELNRYLVGNSEENSYLRHRSCIYIVCGLVVSNCTALMMNCELVRMCVSVHDLACGAFLAITCGRTEKIH